MKRINILCKTLFASGLLMVFLGMNSCKKEVAVDDTKEVATEQNDEKFEENDNKEDDSEILVAAAETNLAEIEIGKLAQTKGTSAHVKEFGQMLQNDHTKALAELKTFADSKQITVPTSITEKGQEHYNDLNDEKSGTDFDHKFADMMVSGHEDAIKKMQDAAEHANDPEVRKWASSMVPTLQAHLEHARKIKDETK